ncbi:hypothetical protein Tco_1301950 [Tanacetum coccineum]
MWPCRVEEKMTLKEVDGQAVEEIETKIIAKDGTITRVPGKFQGYETSEEEPLEQPRRHDLYGFVDHPQLQQGNLMNEFAPHWLPQSKDNMNGWLLEDEDEVDSDLESTASSKPVWEKTTEDDHDRASRGSTTVKGGIYNYGGQHNYTRATTQVDFQKMAPNRQSGPSSSNNNENPDVATLIAQQLQAIITQVANNTNNANNGNNGGGNGTDALLRHSNLAIPRTRGRVAAMALSWNDFKALMVEEFCPNRFHELAKLVPHLVTPESSRIKRYIAGLAPEIRRMLRATQPTTIQTAILRAGILTDEAVSCGTLTKGSDKIKGVDEPSKTGGFWKDNKKSKTGTGFVATTPARNEVGSSNPKDCRAPVGQVAPVNVVRMNNNPRVCHECGSPDHFCNTCPKLNRAPGQVGNQLALEGSRNN